MSIIIPAIFLLCFCIESIFGFGGLVLSFAFLSFFVDIKSLIFVGMYIGIFASIFVLVTDRHAVDKKLFLDILPTALVGTIIGVFVITFFSNQLLLKIFAIFLILFGLRWLLMDSVQKLPALVKKLFIFVGGVMQGIYGTGGPFVVMAIKNDFKSKSQLRSTMAVFFILFNIVRVAQLNIQGKFNSAEFFSLWWIIFPLFVAIYVGYHVHLNISERFFHKIVALLLFGAGIILLTR